MDRWKKIETLDRDLTEKNVVEKELSDFKDNYRQYEQLVIDKIN